jgi:hypothetical protein
LDPRLCSVFTSDVLITGTGLVVVDCWLVVVILLILLVERVVVKFPAWGGGFSGLINEVILAELEFGVQWTRKRAIRDRQGGPRLLKNVIKHSCKGGCRRRVCKLRSQSSWGRFLWLLWVPLRGLFSFRLA